jgi:predicted RNA-binding protein with PUA-like domain
VSYWLLKTEPNAYSYADLEKKHPEPWDGVRNPAAQGNMRRMKVGDTCVIYHTGDEKSAIGLAKVVKEAYPDPNDEKLSLIDVSPTGRLPEPVTLKAIKANPLFADSPLVRMGRLSVVQLTPEQFAALRRE